MSENVEKTESTGAVNPVFRQWQNVGLMLGVVGMIALIISGVMDKSVNHKAFWSSALYGYIFWLGLTLGCCTLTYLHHSIRAHWSLALLRIVEAGNKNIAVMFVLGLVIALFTLNGHQVYPWADPKVFEHLHRNKQLWYTSWFWAARAVGYFAFWFFTTRYLNRSSARQDDERDEALADARASRAAPWGVIHVVFLTLAFTDWLMSLDPNWFSTLYGAWHMTTQLLATIAMGTFMILTLRARKPYSDVVSPVLTKDLGNMMLGFTMVFGYFTLSQFLIIWSGNLPEEIAFFVNRFRGGAVLVGMSIVLFQFFLPFLLLVSGRTKRTYTYLRFVAGWVFCWRIIDMWWQTVPFLRHNPLDSRIFVDIAAILGVGGIWAFFFFKHLREREVIPAHDNRLLEQKASFEAHSHA
jgi:hypothetical protein